MAGNARVFGSSEMRVVGRGSKRALIHRKAAEQRGPRRPQACDHGRVARCDLCRARAKASGPSLPCH